LDNDKDYDVHVFKDFNKIKNEINIIKKVMNLIKKVDIVVGYKILDPYYGDSICYLLNRLSDIPSVIAVKEDAKLDDYTKEIVDKISDRVAIVVSGNGLQQWSKVSEKCQAWLTGIGNFCPKTEIDFYKYHLEGNKEKCDEIIEKIEKPYFWIKDNLSWHLGIKSTLHILGIMDKQERMPYKSLNDEQHEKVINIMKEISKNTHYFTI
jgi:dihydrodipicolinate synthase/N-acetylneuraminate lyase